MMRDAFKNMQERAGSAKCDARYIHEHAGTFCWSLMVFFCLFTVFCSFSISSVLVLSNTVLVFAAFSAFFFTRDLAAANSSPCFCVYVKHT